MALLIDGYNLLHASGVLPSDKGPATFERARLALLDFLAETIDPAQISQTTVVFDANDAPPGLPTEGSHRGLRFCFARGYRDADEMICQLIEKNSAPRSLTVVSSDHQIQRAARRRKAHAIDSDDWCRRQLHGGSDRPASDEAASDEAKPHQGSLSKDDVQHWLDVFRVHPDEQPNEQPDDQLFPPGYADNLVDEDDD
ncbi:MAG: NYN domain-containing protein [Pirellulaceae bacterium]|jgi:hypothetical protein|nr:NYN domain-containing protein [Pirellulaceae bacterium]